MLLLKSEIFGPLISTSGAKGDWDFWISDLVKIPMELIFNPVVNFGEIWRAHLAKSTLLTSTLVPLRSFQIF